MACSSKEYNKTNPQPLSPAKIEPRTVIEVDRSGTVGSVFRPCLPGLSYPDLGKSSSSLVSHTISTNDGFDISVQGFLKVEHLYNHLWSQSRGSFETVNILSLSDSSSLRIDYL